MISLTTGLWFYFSSLHPLYNPHKLYILSDYSSEVNCSPCVLPALNGSQLGEQCYGYMSLIYNPGEFLNIRVSQLTRITYLKSLWRIDHLSGLTVKGIPCSHNYPIKVCYWLLRTQFIHRRIKALFYGYITVQTIQWYPHDHSLYTHKHFCMLIHFNAHKNPL